MKDQTFNYIAILIITVILIVVAVKIRGLETSCQSHTNLTAQINEVRRSLEDLGKEVRANKNGLIFLDGELTGGEYYDFRRENVCVDCHTKQQQDEWNINQFLEHYYMADGGYYDWHIIDDNVPTVP